MRVVFAILLLLLAAALLPGCVQEPDRLAYLRGAVQVRGALLDSAYVGAGSFKAWQNEQKSQADAAWEIGLAYQLNVEAQKRLNSGAAPLSDTERAIDRDLREGNALLHRGLWLLWDAVNTGDSDPSEGIAKLEAGVAALDGLGPRMARAIRAV